MANNEVPLGAQEPAYIFARSCQLCLLVGQIVEELELGRQMVRLFVTGT